MRPPRLAVAGDLTLTDSVLNGIRREGAGPWFGPLAEALAHDADGVLCNLEVPPVDGGESRTGKPVLRSGRLAINVLPVLKVLGASLANNHIMDWGRDGVVETVEELSRLGIATTGLVGGGPASGPARFSVRGWSVGVLAYADTSSGTEIAPNGEFGVSGFDVSRAAEDISRLAGEVDAVLVGVHAGCEQVEYPEPRLRDEFRTLIRAGAALVFGHHPHCVRGMERHAGGWIAHGLGNFVTPDHVAHKNGSELRIHRFHANKVGAVLLVEPAGRGSVTVAGVRFVHTDRLGRSQVLTGRQAESWQQRLDRLGSVLDRPDYAAFHERESIRSLRAYSIKLGVARALREGPRLSQAATAFRLLLGRGKP